MCVQPLNHAVHRRNDCQAEAVGTIATSASRAPATFTPSKAHVTKAQLTSATFLAGAKYVPADVDDAAKALKAAIGLQLMTLAVNVLPVVLYNCGRGRKVLAFPIGGGDDNTNLLLTPPTVVPASATFADVGAAKLPVYQLLRMPTNNNGCALAAMCAALSSELERRPASERSPDALAKGAVERAHHLLGITADKSGPRVDAMMSRFLAGSTSLYTMPSEDVARGTVIAFAQAMLEQAHVGNVSPPDTASGGFSMDHLLWPTEHDVLSYKVNGPALAAAVDARKDPGHVPLVGECGTIHHDDNTEPHKSTPIWYELYSSLVEHEVIDHQLLLGLCLSLFFEPGSSFVVCIAEKLYDVKGLGTSDQAKTNLDPAHAGKVFLCSLCLHRCLCLCLCHLHWLQHHHLHCLHHVEHLLSCSNSTISTGSARPGVAPLSPPWRRWH